MSILDQIDRSGYRSTFMRLVYIIYQLNIDVLKTTDYKPDEKLIGRQLFLNILNFNPYSVLRTNDPKWIDVYFHQFKDFLYVTLHGLQDKYFQHGGNMESYVFIANHLHAWIKTSADNKIEFKTGWFHTYQEEAYAMDVSVVEELLKFAESVSE